MLYLCEYLPAMMDDGTLLPGLCFAYSFLLPALFSLLLITSFLRPAASESYLRPSFNAINIILNANF